MWGTEVSTEIATPIETVYQYLADFRRHKEWSKGVAEVEQMTDGEVRVGTEFKASETVPMKFTSFARITALEPPKVIAWDAWDEDGDVRSQWSFHLEPSDGGTRVTQRCAFWPQKLFGTLMLYVMRRWQMAGENRASLARLKAILEGA